MNNCRTEKVTLHFDLNHCPAHSEFTLSVLGKKYALRPHSDETRASHAAANRALAAMAAHARRKVSHFAEDVEMPADAVGIHLVTCPAKDADALLPDLALPF